MEQIKPGKYFEMTYTLSRVNPDGTEEALHEMTAEDPEKAIFGVTRGFVPALEKALEGLKPGDSFDVVATPENGFGPYDPEEVVTLPKDIFMVDGKFDEEAFRPGALAPMMTADGYRIDGLIKEVTPDSVVVDFNHPLAKDNVRLKGTVTLVRDATPEELMPQQGCGGGCGGGCCGGGAEEGNCGGGCCGGC
ncbi:MAG: peptidylprolyl isomerase [Muribaculaceae bacterium]|nr:peptidylprolyl isomerase [Muribaculaceae bacterium]